MKHADPARGWAIGCWRVVACLWAAFALTPVPRSHAQAPRSLVSVTADRVVVRAAPSTDAPEVTTLARGTKVALLERTDAWVKVSFGVAIGWVPAGTVSGTAVKATPVPQAAVAAPARARPERRGGLSAGLLASVTPITASGGESASHVAGSAFIQYEHGALLLYAAPSYGTGAGYRSTMLGGGLGIRLFATGPITLRALAGYTSYSESSLPSGLAPPAANWQGSGASIGGLVTVRTFGSLALAYRGEFVNGFGSQSNLKFARHGFGLVF